MVGSAHEAMHRLFQHDPGVFARAFRALELPFGDPSEVAVLTNDLTEIHPLERRVDTLLRITPVVGAPFLLLVEAQSRKDRDKPSAWAYYLTYLHAKYRLGVVLLVVCQDTGTAEWANEPITIGLPNWPTVTVRPLVLGPHNVPVVTDPNLASADIPLATLSAITHAKDAGVDAILRALAEALHGLGNEEDLHVFAELTELGLANTAAADTWSKLMSVDLSFYRSKTSQRLRAEGRAEGRVEGKLEDVIDKTLRLLQARGITVPAAAEERIRSCADLDVLDRWFDQAITASDIAEVFAD
ncbi:hypothetical protein [Nocardia testacea]|uniref:hypothetical protein n=1 Tax=Nocardia testacea TaxID=248551 RepID=UPI0033E4D04B